MNTVRLAWILGALSVTAVAVAITAVSFNRTAPPMSPPVLAAEAAMTPAPAAAPDAPPGAPVALPPVALPPVTSAPAPAPVAPMPAVPVVAAGPIAEPNATAQIWECTTKGVKTFSNNPCGDKSTLVDVGPINSMNPTPAVHYARAYAPEPRYVPADAGYDGSSDQESYSELGAESGGNSYAIIQGAGFVVRRRPEQHPHRHPTPNHHNYGPTPRKY